MKALVTGGAGFIGSNVTRLLLDRGHEVTVLDNLSSGYRVNVLEGEVRFVEGDIRDAQTVERAAAGCEVIWHLAASVGNLRAIHDPISDTMVNAVGTLNVLEAARKVGARKVVYSSSAAIFGELKTLPIKEDHPIEPDSPYGTSKLAGEKHALCYHKIHGLEVVCLRYFNVYGENQRYDAYGNVIPIFTTKLLNGETLTVYGDGEQTRDFINVADVARANVLSGENTGVSGAFNLGSGTRITVNVLIKLLEEASGLRANVNYTERRPGEVLHSLADVSAIEAALGFRPEVAMPDGIGRYVKWMRSELERVKAAA
jgi:UDP-glucose 4-epimerase